MSLMDMTTSAIRHAAKNIRLHSAAVLCAAGILAIQGCSVGPKYTPPTAQIPPSYKGDWKSAQPSDSEHKGKWWELFQDAQLNLLEEQLDLHNQSLRAAQDAFLQARAALRISRSAQYPFLTANGGIVRQRQSSNRALFGGSSPVNYSDFLAVGDLSYEVDAWGQVRKSVESSRELAQASAADLETIRLSLHAELASDYFVLRGLDAQKQLLDSNVAAFEKGLELTDSRFRGGLASREDVELATTVLEQTRAQDIDITSARDQFEHAIAVLIGQPASTFSLVAAPMPNVPATPPPGFPSEILQRRPDIAGAERRVASANAQIGIATAAFFPSILLNLSGGFETGAFTSWLSGPSGIWAVGGSVAQTAFDAGRRRAISDQARAAYDQTIAGYQQTVLTAFQQVEDSLSDLRILEEEARTQDAAVAAANRSVAQATNRYKGGLENYLTVITAQTAALDNERTAVGILTRRMTSSVLLIKALGGGWDLNQLPAVN
jgi:NodT family efflux transporter outer membrane factor (OMF) lipoprotein